MTDSINSANKYDEETTINYNYVPTEPPKLNMYDIVEIKGVNYVITPGDGDVPKLEPWLQEKDYIEHQLDGLNKNYNVQAHTLLEHDKRLESIEQTLKRIEEQLILTKEE